MPLVMSTLSMRMLSNSTFAPHLLHILASFTYKISEKNPLSHFPAIMQNHMARLRNYLKLRYLHVFCELCNDNEN